MRKGRRLGHYQRKHGSLEQHYSNFYVPNDTEVSAKSDMDAQTSEWPTLAQFFMM